MFNQLLFTLLGQKKDYLKLKEEVAQTPLEKSINNIIEKINQDIHKIVELNQVDKIY
jgi:hypothetical protein